MKKLLVSLVLILSLNSAQAGLVDDLKASIRPFAVKFLGEKTAVSILGEDPNAVPMPAIPKTQKDAKSTADIVDDVKDSFSEKDKEKYNYAFVREIYLAVRENEANDNEIVRWMNVLSQGAAREGVYQGIILDNIYRGLENYENPSSEKVAEFGEYYFAKYLDRKLTKDRITTINFYSIKRLAAEKTLSVLDAYLLAKKRTDFNAWYGNFSAELANDYPNVFKNKLRVSTDKYRHFAWAKSMPIQFVKSEVLIKLHKVFNALK